MSKTASTLDNELLTEDVCAAQICLPCPQDHDTDDASGDEAGDAGGGLTPWEHVCSDDGTNKQKDNDKLAAALVNLQSQDKYILLPEIPEQLETHRTTRASHEHRHACEHEMSLDEAMNVLLATGSDAELLDALMNWEGLCNAHAEQIVKHLRARKSLQQAWRICQTRHKSAAKIAQERLQADHRRQHYDHEPQIRHHHMHPLPPLPQLAQSIAAPSKFETTMALRQREEELAEEEEHAQSLF